MQVTFQSMNWKLSISDMYHKSFGVPIIWRPMLQTNSVFSQMFIWNVSQTIAVHIYIMSHYIKGNFLLILITDKLWLTHEDVIFWIWWVQGVIYVMSMRLYIGQLSDCTNIELREFEDCMSNCNHILKLICIPCAKFHWCCQQFLHACP